MSAFVERRNRRQARSWCLLVLACISSPVLACRSFASPLTPDARESVGNFDAVAGREPLANDCRPTPEGDRLDYEPVVTDAATFAEPVRITKGWLSPADQTLDACNCGGPLTR